MENFSELNLPEALNHTLAHMQFDTPTPIQAQAIPAALKGQDVLGTAQTGTGKTGAFGIPAVAHVLGNEEGNVLVMTPTRELAVQVMQQLRAMLGKQSKIKTALLIGGEAIQRQLQQLKQKPRIVVGTPGRINDHLERRSLHLQYTNFLVLDETDRMLDMGFTVQIDRILESVTMKRQTLLFSATLPKNIEKMANRYMENPVRVAVGNQSMPAQNIDHEVLELRPVDKYDALLSQLEERKGSILVFMKTKHATEKMAIRLSREGHSADAIHGNLRQNKRDRVIAAFRAQKYRILVATDVAARGLDIPHIEHVINFDLPQNAEDYIHRIGRTARAGAKGSAMCFVTNSDRTMWRMIDRLLNPDAKRDGAHDREERAPRRHGSGGSRDGVRSGERKKFGRGKPAFDKSRSNRPRSDKPRGERSERSEGRSNNRNDSRGEKRYDNRSENRPDSRGGKRYDNRSEGKSYGDKPTYAKNGERNESRGEYRGDKRPSNRNENRSEGRGDSRYQGRSEGRNDSRSENRGEKRYDSRSDNRSDAPRRERGEWTKSKGDTGYGERNRDGGAAKKPYAKSGSKPAYGKDGKPTGKTFHAERKTGDDSRGKPSGKPYRGDKKPDASKGGKPSFRKAGRPEGGEPNGAGGNKRSFTKSSAPKRAA